MVYIGVDVGGTGVQIGLVDEKGTILERGAIPTRLADGWEKQIRDMAECALDVIARSEYTLNDVVAVGVGIPGLADKDGVVGFCTNLGWHNVPFRSEFQKYINKPVYLDNDATVAGLAESIVGITAGTHSSVFMTLGTGVGGGIVINGKVWNGFHGTGSEIGHMILKADGEPCTCGNRGCLERYCSATAIIRMAREAVKDHPESLILKKADGDPAKINAKIVIDSARENDPIGNEVFGQYVSYLGQAMANICNFLDPEVIAIGGGVSRAGDFLLNAIREETKKHVLYRDMEYSRIEIAQLGPDAGIIGAAMLGR